MKKIPSSKTSSVKTYDSVNHPDHYVSGGIECIDAMRASMSPIEFEGYLRGCIFKYLWRFRQKGGLVDLQKAKWYLDKFNAIYSTGG